MVSNGGVVVLGDAADPGGQGTHWHAGAVHLRYTLHISSIFIIFVLPQGKVSLSTLRFFLLYYTMILQIQIGATTSPRKPIHLHMS